MEIIEYIFGNFWHWLGALIFLVCIIDGVIVNMFRVIAGFIEKKKENNPMELPTKAPQGAIWPYEGKMYMFVDDKWITLDDKEE